MLKLIILLALISNLAHASEKILITGSSTVAPLAKEFARAYEAHNRNLRIEVQTGGSSRGIMDTRRNSNDIGMISRDLKKKESDLTKHLVALDGIGIILHSSNPVKELSEKQIVDIYQGKITNWKELGGFDKKIFVISKAAGRSTLELFLKHFKLKYRDIKASAIIGDNEQGIQSVLRNPASLAYVSIGTAEYHIKNGKKLKTLALNGIEATVENVKNKTYPLARPLHFVTRGKLDSRTEKFIQFVKSKHVKKLVKAQYFVPVY